jgi:nicotinamide-nucleotide amidase
LAFPRAVVVVTGSELVRGDRRDLNGPFLAQELTRLGLEPDRVVLVGDRPEELAAALAESLRADLCVVSGGLGPTHDDRTVELLAAATRRGLVVDEALEAEIEAFSRGVAERLERPFGDFLPGIRKQASLPEGGVSLGLAGTAPAILLEHDQGRVAVALPGPPAELRRLWPNAVTHAADSRAAGAGGPARAPFPPLLRPTESAVARVLAENGGEGEGFDATVCARDLEIHVDLVVRPWRRGRGGRVAEALLAAFRTTFSPATTSGPWRKIVLDLCRDAGSRWRPRSRVPAVSSGRG